MMRLTLGLLALALLGGCSLYEKPDSGSEPQLPAVAVSEPTPGKPAAADSAPPPQPETAAPIVAETKPAGKEDIQSTQARLRKAGFDPGPVDGILGPKTKAALARLESACATLNDLLGSSAADAVQNNAAPGGLMARGPSVNSAESIRVLQVRLKEAEFDPGPIDGIAGAKTKAALARLGWGCAENYE